MKEYILLLFLILPLFIMAQEVDLDLAEMPDPPDVEPGFWDAPNSSDSLSYSAGGVVGAITIDGVTYSQIRLRPELEFGKIGIGLDIDLLIDANGKARFEDWDDWRDYLGKLFYFRYGTRKDLFYFKTGSISDYTLAHGLIFNNYSNMLRYPAVKNIGSYVGINTDISGLGMELYTHDLFSNQILAARVHAKPFNLLQIPWLKKLSLGVNAGWDRDQLGRFADSDKDGVPDVYDRFPKDPLYAADTDGDGIPDEIDWDLNGNGIIDDPSVNPYVDEVFPGFSGYYPDYELDSQCYPDILQEYTDKLPLQIYSLDYELPLLETGDFLLSSYGEIASIKDHGSGFVWPGFSANYKFLQAKMEFRNFGSGFLPSYFDRIYEGKRSEMQVITDPVTKQKHYFLSTKDEILSHTKPALGWFGCLQADFSTFAYFRAAFQDMYGSDVVAGKSLWMKLGITPSFFPKLKQASLYYSQTDANYIDFIHLRNENAHVIGELVYQISDNANLIGRYSEFYTDINQDGRIKGRDEIQEILSFGVEFTF